MEDGLVGKVQYWVDQHMKNRRPQKEGRRNDI